MPEWYLVIAALSFVSLLGAIWSPLLLALPLLVLAVGALVVESIAGAATRELLGAGRERASAGCGAGRS